MTLRAFQCFAAGTHTDSSGRTSSYSEQQLVQMAAAYDPKKRAAPLTLGHPENDLPNYGEVRALVAHGPALFAIADVSNGLQTMVQNKNYTNVSASFFQPDNEANPYKGAYYLKHVGFLGAVPPAVKGMQPLAFALPTDFGNGEFSSQVLSFAERDRHTLPQRLEMINGAVRDLRRACPGIALLDAARNVERAIK